MKTQDVRLTETLNGKAMAILARVIFGVAADGTQDRASILEIEYDVIHPNTKKSRAQLIQDMEKDPSFQAYASVKARTEVGQVMIGINQVTGEVANGPTATMALARPRSAYWIHKDEVSNYLICRISATVIRPAGPWGLLTHDEAAIGSYDVEVLGGIELTTPNPEQLKEQKRAALLSMARQLFQELQKDPQALEQLQPELQRLLTPFPTLPRIKTSDLSASTREELTKALRANGQPESWENDPRPMFLTTRRPGSDPINEKGDVARLSRKLDPWIRDLLTPSLEISRADLKFTSGLQVTMDLGSKALEPVSGLNSHTMSPNSEPTEEEIKTLLDETATEALQLLTRLAPHIAVIGIELNMTNPKSIHVNLGHTTRKRLDEMMIMPAPDDEIVN